MSEIRMNTYQIMLNDVFILYYCKCIKIPKKRLEFHKGWLNYKNSLT